MKAKISSKVMMSYVLILFVTFLLTLLLSNVVLDKVLRQNEYSKLREQGNAIVNIIKDERVNQNLQRINNYLNILNIDKLTNADIYISVNEKLIYRSSKSLTIKEITSLIKSKGNKKHIIFRKQILTNTESVAGNLLLISDTSNIESIKENMNKALIIAMLLAMLIAFFISFWMQKNITKPLKTLIKEMRETDIDSNKALTMISTGDEIEELYNVYNNMLTRIKKSSDGRKRLFQNTSHELKTPLMAIQGYAEAIKDKVVSGEEVEESLNIIIAKSQNLKKVVEETVYLSKLENSDLEYAFENVAFNQYLNNFIDEYRAFSTTKNTTKLIFDNQIGEDVFVQLDSDKFNSVLNNILDNALRYAKHLIKVELSNRDYKVSIKIIDDGEGFKNNEQDKIFERFYKGDKGQSGIGLAIAHTIVTQHQGSLKADNHISGGAIFEILLPKVK